MLHRMLEMSVSLDNVIKRHSDHHSSLGIGYLYIVRRHLPEFYASSKTSWADAFATLKAASLSGRYSPSKHPEAPYRSIDADQDTQRKNLV